MKTKILTLLFTIGTLTFLQAQQYEEHIISSKYLNTERTIRVSLPLDYSPEVKYPVIYITDGSSDNYTVALSYINALSPSSYKLIPPSILVGIVHENRNDDFYQRGESLHFKKYLMEEVVPYIDENYSSSGFNTLIGHSNGAEFNHSILMDVKNPFRGFISLSTYFSKSEHKEQLSKFITEYQGRKLYYFMGNALQEPKSRYESGHEMHRIMQETPNTQIEWFNQDFEANHNSLVPIALSKGLQHVFKDYSSVENYASIQDYSKSYLKDLKENHGVEGSFSIADIDGYMMKILMNKDLESYPYMLEFIEQNNLWQGGGLDPANIGNHYFVMEDYKQCISYYKEAVLNINSVEEMVFYYNLDKPIKSFEKLGRTNEIIDFLKQSREVLSQEYQLKMSYKIAFLAIKHGDSLEEGKASLNYCKNNYEQNKLFSKEDLGQLEIKYKKTSPSP